MAQNEFFVDTFFGNILYLMEFFFLLSGAESS